MAAVQEVKQVKARYFRAVDTKNWALLREQLTDDVKVNTTASMGIKTTGADTFISFLKLTIATGVWALQDLLIWLGTVKVIGFGHYHETYTVVDGQWRISSLKLTRRSGRSSHHASRHSP